MIILEKRLIRNCLYVCMYDDLEARLLPTSKQLFLISSIRFIIFEKRDGEMPHIELKMTMPLLTLMPGVDDDERRSVFTNWFARLTTTFDATLPLHVFTSWYTGYVLKGF